MAASIATVRAAGAKLGRLLSDNGGQAVVTYAIAACLLAAALVVGSYAWKRDVMPAQGPAVEQSR